MKKILIVTILFGMFCSCALAEEQNADFNFRFFLTQQDEYMDWWYAIPSRFGPHISEINNVAKKEYFKIMPFFNNYGRDEKNNVEITYDLTILRSDHSIYEQIKNIEGFSGKFKNSYLIPAKDRLVVCFEPEDNWGDYIVKIEAFDKIKNQKVVQEKKINLKPFELPQVEKDEMEWIFTYPSAPTPEKAMAGFLNASRPYIGKDGDVLWSAIWFYRKVFEENDFLIPETIKFFKEEANIQQKKDIILLFSFLNMTKKLDLKGDLKKYSKEVKRIKILDPYSKIINPDQLDMLWAEFFATARVKPIRQIISSFYLSKYMGTLKKVKKQELDVNSKKVEKEVMFEATFSSALWSLESNCSQSSLLYQYCVGIIESKELNDNEKGYLGSILNSVYEKSKKEKEQKDKNL